MARKPVPSRREILKGATALTLGTMLGADSARAREMSAREKELYELAKKEGEITWYTAHSDDVTAQALGRNFEQHYPGIKASVVRTTAQVAFQRVSQEIRAGAMQVDVFSSTDVGHYAYLKEKNVVLLVFINKETSTPANLFPELKNGMDSELFQPVMHSRTSFLRTEIWLYGVRRSE